MSFRDGAYVYSDFEPSEEFRETGSTFIADKIRVDDDEWIEDMVGQHADQFLLSIQQNKKHVSSRSPTRARRNNNNNNNISVYNNTGDEDGRDTMRRNTAPVSRLPSITALNINADSGNYIQNGSEQRAALNINVDSGNYTQNGSEQRDENENTDKSTRSNMNNATSNNRVADPTSSTIQHNYLSSTERSGSNASNYISSTGSSESGADATRVSYDDSILSTESKFNWNQKQNGRRHHPRGEEIRLSLSSTQSILDDLQDIHRAISQHSRSDDRLSVDARKRDDGGGFYPERPLWKLLLERQWDWARERVRWHPGEAKEYIRLPLISVDAAAAGADEYQQRVEESDHVHSALPLHLACSVRPLPPLVLLRSLIEAYPEACRRSQESSGFLPIHMAADLRSTVSIHKAFQGKGGPQTTRTTDRQPNGFGTSHDSRHDFKGDSAHHGGIIELLLSHYPESIARRETTNGMTPLHIAASTTRAENAVVSPVASTVLNILMARGSEYPATLCKDKNGMTPRDWAWRNIDFFCPRCGMQTTRLAKPGWAMNDKQEEALVKLNVGTKCRCNQPVSVHKKCLHPLLQNEILKHLGALSSTVRYKSEIGTVLKHPKLKTNSPRSAREKQPQQKDSSTILSRRVLDDIREYTNDKQVRQKRVTVQRAAKKEKTANQPEKTASLHMKIRLTDLLHPSNPVKRRGIKLKGCCVPNPYFEVFAAHRRGMSKTYYRSYPLHESTEGTWEDAFLDLGLTHGQLRNGTHGAGYIEIGIRVMHCPDNGNGIRLIGTCQLSLEALEREQRERRQLLDDVRRLRDVIGDDGRKVDVSLPEPERHPILDGFKVTGNLQVLTLAIR